MTDITVDGEALNEELMSFGAALSELKNGRKIARKGWNGKGMYLSYIAAHNYSIGGNGVEHPKSVNDAVNDSISFLPWIGMKTADNSFVPWLASQSDMLADDWVIVK